MKNLKKYFTKSTIIISLISLGIGFAAGFFFEKSRTPSFGEGRIKGMPSQTGGPQGQVRGASTSSSKNGSVTQTSNLKQTIGEITKMDDTSITIKTTDGGSKIVLLSDSTTFNKAAPSSKSDLKTGLKVTITGDSNADGSITGKTININSDSSAATATVTPTTTK